MKRYNYLKISQYLVVLVMAMTVTLSANAQHGRGDADRSEKIEAMKVGFITTKLDLTAEEAQQFWPVYNEFQGAIREVKKEERKIFRITMKDFEEVDDKELESSIDVLVQLRLKEAEIRANYHQELKKVLPVKKIALLYRAEHEFKKKVLSTLKERIGEK